MNEQSVERHYDHRRDDLEARILQSTGKKDEDISWKDVSDIGELHLRKSNATREMADLISLQPGTRVLDAGCGIGGPSLHLAVEYGCSVTGIDLTGAFCDVAKAFARRFGLEEQLTYQQGSVLDLPFDDGVFDVVWTQHVSMNIEDKDRFFVELHRVLKPGGMLACNDIIAGTGEPIDFPVPWAKTPDISFLVTAEDHRSVITRAGFSIESWDDRSQEALEWLENITGRWADMQPPQSPLVENFKLTMSNQVNNFSSGRTRVVQIIGRRDSEEDGDFIIA